jgi:hypothetical protein
MFDVKNYENGITNQRVSAPGNGASQVGIRAIVWGIRAYRIAW